MEAQSENEKEFTLNPKNATCHFMGWTGYTIDHKKFTNGLREMADRIDKEYTEKEGKEYVSKNQTAESG
jgi:hypothetical protein